MSDYQYSNLLERLGSVEKDVRQTRERVFNGLSDLPGEVRWIRNLLVGMLVSAVLGLGAMYMQTQTMITAVDANTQRMEAFEKALENIKSGVNDESDSETEVRTEGVERD